MTDLSADQTHFGITEPYPPYEIVGPARRILDEICATHNVSREILLGSRRNLRLDALRRELAHRLRHEHNWTIVRIAKLIGDRDAGSIRNMLSRYQGNPPRPGGYKHKIPRPRRGFLKHSAVL